MGHLPRRIIQPARRGSRARHYKPSYCAFVRLAFVGNHPRVAVIVESGVKFIPALNRRVAAAVSLVMTVVIGTGLLFAGAGNRFVYSQLKHDGAWDPYPQVHERVFEMLRSMTNIPIDPSRRAVSLADDRLFDAPFLLVKGNAALRLSKDEKLRLRRYIDRGGFVFFDDTLADSRGPFAQSVRGLMAELYPERPFQKLTVDHALFRSFFLLRQVAGRRIADKSLEGLDVGGEGGAQARTAVVYCPNDLLGAWMRDNVGQYSFSCEPGGEAQRWESFKLTVNVIFFSLTGTYKKDAIHQPFIEMKLGS